ncbi:MAG TPA: transketolase [Gemmatimonadales bacterium]|nr:transketolase [Gemmatimonadales bacterium]
MPAPLKSPAADLDLLCINTIRTLAMDAVQAANSGHPGTPMALAPVAYVLYTRHLRHNPRHPDWPDRDRFVLSAGHASMLLYASLHLAGYDLSLEDLRRFRQWGSRTPGHPEHGVTPGVETTTGPLGQGFANGVGMAIAEAHLAARFNRPGHEIVNHRTFAIASDGDLMEGISHEAASLAGHLKLGKLIYLYDDNHITIEGATDLAFSEDVAQRFTGYGWHVQRVADGNDLAALDAAIQAAEAETARPSLIAVRTHIGWGSPHKQDSAEAHGSPLGAEEIALTKAVYGWPPDAKFLVPEEVRTHFGRCVERGEKLQAEWEARQAAYEKAFPDLAAEWRAALAGELPAGWERSLPAFKAEDGAQATRASSQKVINAIAPVVATLVGGAADLAPSTNTLMKGAGDLEAGSLGARNMHFGIREHAMGGVLNGMALHRGVRPYGATFLVFSDYMRPSLRLAALMGLPVIVVFTHDSVGLGEDGPTHQPIEQLAALRAIPGMTVIRPADGPETAAAWRAALLNTGGPTLMVLSRQKVPLIDRTRFAPADGLLRGGYVLAEADGGKPRLLLLATGSEVGLALAAREILEKEGTPSRVVSMPSLEIFARQDAGYRDAVLPPAVTARLAVEAAAGFGWHRWVGSAGDVVSIEHFGASAPYERIFQEFGFTAENVAKRARAVLARAGGA